MVALHPVTLIGGHYDGETIQLDRSLWAVRVPHPVDEDADPMDAQLGFDLYSVLPAAAFGRVVFVAKTGGNAADNADLARTLLKPEVYQAWLQGRAYP